MARAFAMPYKFIIIILLIIICWSLCSSASSASSAFANQEAGEEPFTTMYDKANDRANPLASSQTPLKNVIPTGINEGAAASLRQMNQIALNIPTADANAQGTFSQTPPTNMVSPRIDNEGSFLGMVKFCKDHAAANNDRPFDDPRFNENCGMCVTSGTLIDKTTFDTNSGSKATGVLVYQNDKKQFWKEKDDNKYPFTHAIPSLNSATCFGAIKGTDASPALAISQADYDKFRKRSACIHGNGSASSCGTCMTNNTKSWIDMAGGFKTITMLLWGSGNAKVSIGGNVVGQKGLSLTASASFPLGLVPEDTPVQIEVNPLSSQAQQLQPVSLFGAIYATTPSGGEYRLAIDEFLEMDAETGSFPRAGLPRTFRVSQGDVSCVELKPQPSKTKLTVTGPFPLTFVDSDQLASHDCPVGPYIMNDTNVGLFTTTDPCLNPKGQSVDNYTDGCLRATLTGAGCSTEGSWYGDLDLLRTDYKGKSTAEMKTGIDTTSRRDKAFMLKCFNQDLSTPCDPYLSSSSSSSASAGGGGIPNQACMTYLYTNQSAQSDFVGAAYSGTPYISNPSGTQLPFCQSAGSLNPASAAGLAQLQSAAQGYKGTTGIPAVKSYLTDVFTKSTGTLPQNLPDAKGGRYDSWGACIGTAVQVATTPGSMNVTATPGNRTVDVSWTTPNTGGATITGYTVTYTPSESGGMVTSTGTNSATITGLRNAVTYTVRVVATNVMGESSGTTTVAPVQPVCATAGQMVPFATSQCSTSSGLVGMWQKYIFGSDSNGGCTQEASGNRVCNSNCPGATSSGVSSETTPLYLLDFTDPFTGYRDHQFFLDNKAIAVKLFQGPHTQNNNEQSIVNPVKKGMKVTWAGNTTPATVMDVGVSHSNPRGLVHHVIYITLDKQVNTSISTFTLLNAEAQGCAYVPCSTAGQLVPANNNQCDASGMRQNYIFKSDVNGACVQDASGARWCDATCPGALTQGGCAAAGPAGSRKWFSIASSSDGVKLVAVDDSPGQIYTSTDSGLSWTPRESNSNWRSVTSSSDGVKLVAGSASQIYTSTDSGVTWTLRDSNNRLWMSVASSSDGVKLVAAEYGGQLYTSTDSGVSWTPRESNRYWQSVASSSDGVKRVACVYNGQIFTSIDSGISWNPYDSIRAWSSVASSSDGVKLVAVVEPGQIYTSTNSGLSWTPREMNRSWRGVASSSDGVKLVAVVSQNGQIYTSTDSGVSWTPRESNRYWLSVTSSSDGRKLAAVDYGGFIYTSTDFGVTWRASASNSLPLPPYVTSITARTTTGFTVNWDGATGATSYTYGITPAAGTSNAILGQLGSGSVTWSGLSAGVSYTVTITSTNAHGSAVRTVCANAGQIGSDCSSTGMRQNYTWADSNGSCVKNNNGAAVCDSTCPNATAQGGCAYCSTNPSSKPGCPGYVAPCPSTTPGCPGYVAPVAPPTPSGVSISSVDWANGTVTVTWNPAIVTSNPELNVHYYVYSLAGFGIIPVERTLPASATSVTASGLIKTSQIMQGNTQEGAIFSLWAMNSLGKYGANAGLSVKP